MNLKKLKDKAADLRIKTFNAFIEKGEAHLGGSFSMIELLITIYELIITKKDKFILSKAHASFPLCILLREKGLNTEIKTHLEIDEKNGINCTTGVWAMVYQLLQEWLLLKKNKKGQENLRYDKRWRMPRRNNLGKFINCR